MVNMLFKKRKKYLNYSIIEVCITFLFISVIALALAAFSEKEEIDKANFNVSTHITVYHDDERNVTCWIYDSPYTNGKTMSCIPDNQLT